MKYFTVKDVSSILSVSEETVRRWIRENKLSAERGSGRQGSKVSEESLKIFLKNNRASITSTASQIIGSSVGCVIASQAGPIIGCAISALNNTWTNTFSRVNNDKSSKKNIILDLMNKEMELENKKREIEVEIFKLQKQLELMDIQVERIKLLIDECSKEQQ